MSALKSYSLSIFSEGVALDQLNTEIYESESVTNYIGVVKNGTTLSVLGDSMNEAELDQVINDHTPNHALIFVKKSVKENKEFAEDLIQKLKEKNLMEGLNSIDQAAWIHHRLRKVDYILSDNVTVVQIDVLNLVISGDVETAEEVLGQMPPDDMTEAQHWWTQERIEWVRNEIRSYLDWEQI
jgi:thioredoxin-like negative regulator of GroEL